MFRFILKRLFQGLFVIIGVSIMIFVLSRIVPGDAARLALGPRATQEAVDMLSEEMNLNEPIPVQYFYWVQDVLQGDLGRSLTSKRPVTMDVKQFLPATLELVFFAGFMMVTFSLILGMLAAKHRDSFLDGLIRVMAYTGIALPAFVAAVLLILLFGFVWPVLPVIGRLSPGMEEPARITGMYVLDGILTGNFAVALDACKHLFPPAFALALGPMFQDARVLRSSLTDNANKEYMAVAKGYGFPGNLLIRKYLLRPSATPVITVMGLDFAAMVGNAFLVEKIFNWPGLSRYGINSMLSKDLNSIVAVVLIIGIVFLVVNLAVDMIIAMIDPRIRLGD